MSHSMDSLIVQTPNAKETTICVKVENCHFAEASVLPLEYEVLH